MEAQPYECRAENAELTQLLATVNKNPGKNVISQKLEERTIKAAGQGHEVSGG